jgi:hypothetical protein
MLSPNEFQTVCGLDYMKNWMRSIKHCGMSLGAFIKNKKTQYGGKEGSVKRMERRNQTGEQDREEEVKKRDEEQEFQKFLEFQRFLRFRENLTEQNDEQRFLQGNNKQAGSVSLATSAKKKTPQIRNFKKKPRPSAWKTKNTFRWSKLRYLCCYHELY